MLFFDIQKNIIDAKNEQFTFSKLKTYEEI